MNMPYQVAAAAVRRAGSRWKWLKFLRHTSVLGIITTALVLLFGVAMVKGWVFSETAAIIFFVVLGLLASILWTVVAIVAIVTGSKRDWLAGAVERGDHRLMDRLHTLLYLERDRGNLRQASFAVRIAQQTQQLFAEKTANPAFPPTRTLPLFLVFAGLLILTALFYNTYSPWDRMQAASASRAVAAAPAEKPLDLEMPATNNVEQQKSWGEVRITDPGGDLKVTKVDVVPLQIEAAANQALKTVSWASAINGAGETNHPLAEPTEPRYAVYQPVLYLDELRLSDWDVMTYYARASTEKSNVYASDVYFVEVRPFREDIAKMAGGENGKAYQCLSEMTALIGRQQHIVRQTHQHVQHPMPEESMQAQDRKKLSEAEADLGESTRHLYAKMAAEMENKPIGEALDALAQAEKSLKTASKELGENNMNEGQARERSGLTELIAARKIFQKTVNEHPKDFEEPQNGGEQTPIAESRKLSEMAEFRNEAKASQEFVDKLLEQQKNLERKSSTASRSEFAKLSEQEKTLRQSLDEFQQQHPQVFKGTQPQLQQAVHALDQAAKSLEQKGTDARSNVRDATQQIAKLGDAMKNQAAGQQLANAYKLKQMLDKQINTMDQAARDGSHVSEQDLRQSAGDARETINELRRVAEQEPTRDAFGKSLRDSLSGENKVNLDAKLSRLQQASDAAARKQSAEEARDALGKVSQAFEASQPGALQMARQQDALKPDAHERLEQGLAELQSLIAQQEGKRQLSPEDLRKQAAQARGNLTGALAELYGKEDERTKALLVQIEENLKPENPLYIELLKKLMMELQHYSVETSDRLAKKEDKPEVTNIDPSRLPPAYRGRIQKYFQKLSEK